LTGLCITASPGDNKANSPPSGEYDFGDKVLVVWPRPGTTSGWPGGWFEKAKVRRLGDNYFFSGRYAGQRENKKFGTVVFWMPISEVGYFLEFESYEAAQQAHETWEKDFPGNKEPSKPLLPQKK